MYRLVAPIVSGNMSEPAYNDDLELLPQPFDGALDPVTVPGLTAQPGRRAAARHYLFVRHRHNWTLLFKFGLVGGSGVFVNLAVFALAQASWGDALAIFYNLPSTSFNIRNYHVFSTVAFLVANVSNYLLNRVWTFNSRGTSHWLSEYGPFLAIGLGAQALGLLLLTALLHPDALPGMLGFQLNEVMAQAITVILMTPISFVGNKLWTFRAVRGAHRQLPPNA